MNILKKLLSCSGKMAISAVQAAGLAAVVGVAGIAAYQFLGAPEDDNTAFSPFGSDSEVVYVSGANTGGYATGVGDGGVATEKNSSLNISSETLKRMDRRNLAARAEQEMEEENSRVQSVIGSQTAAGSYDTEGLGMGANRMSEEMLQNGLGGVSAQQLAGMKNVAGNIQQQAQQARAKSLASAKGTGAFASSGSSSGGADPNLSFTIQNSNKNGKGSDKLSQNALASSSGEGAKMHGSSGFSRYKDGTGLDGKRVDGKGELEYLRKHAAMVADNADRSAVDATGGFLGVGMVSGGLMIASENVTTGQGSNSSDFDLDSDLRTLGRNLTDDGKSDNSRSKAGAKLFFQLLWRFWAATTLIGIMMSLMWVPVIGKIAQALITSACLKLANGMLDKVTEFRDVFGASNWDKVGNVLAGVVTVMALGTWGNTSFSSSGWDQQNTGGDAFSTYYDDLREMFGVEFTQDGEAQNAAREHKQGKDMIKEIKDKIAAAKEAAQNNN